MLLLKNCKNLLRHLKCSFTITKTNGFCKNISEDNKLLKFLCKKIETTGPITIADYMKEVLISPLTGYYMTRDVFGSKGDFITSPEISQIFGELIGVWFLTEWNRLGKPKPLQLVEFGPGRGTLTDDFLRVFKKFLDNDDTLHVHLVEASPHLTHVQQSKLCSTTINGDLYGNIVETKYEYPLTWHKVLETVPDGFTFFLAHEFFDALPMHKFQKTETGWREVLIDAKDGKLQFVLSRNETPASKLLIAPDEKRDHVEVSPESCVLLHKIMKRMEEDGGISMIVDYGHLGNKTDTFRSFKNHKLHDPLDDPGDADLTADVDFSFLMTQAKDKALVYGPLAQRNFLTNMGVQIRLESLLKNADIEQQKLLKSGVEMLTDPNQMGERFKFLALYPLVLKPFLDKYPPVGF